MLGDTKYIFYPFSLVTFVFSFGGGVCSNVALAAETAYNTQQLINIVQLV